MAYSVALTCLTLAALTVDVTSLSVKGQNELYGEAFLEAGDDDDDEGTSLLAVGETGPIDNVQAMIAGMIVNKTNEGIAAAASYQTEANACLNRSSTLTTQVETHTATIDAKSTLIAEKTLAKEAEEANFKKRKASKGKNADLLTEKVNWCSKESADYQGFKSDNKKSIDSLDHAMATMAARTAHLALVQHMSFLQLDSALSETVRALAHKTDRGNAHNPDAYKFHSGEITKLLLNLRNDFTSTRDKMALQWQNTSAACATSKLLLATDMEADMTAMTSHTTQIGALVSEIAVVRADLQTASNDLDADSRSLTTNTKSCELKARTYDQQASLRKQMMDPLVSLTGQLAVLNNAQASANASADAVAANATANAAKKAAVTARIAALKAKKEARRAAVNTISLLQEDESTRVVTSFLARGKEDTSAQEAQKEAITQVLRDAARKLSSPELAMLVMKLGGDHFKGVKIMINNLITKLLDENNREIAKSHFCDKEVELANTVRTHALAKADVTQADLTSLEADQETLVDVTMPATIKEIADDTAFLADLVAIREATKRGNLVAIKRTKKAKTALIAAKATYKKLAGIKAKSEAKLTGAAALEASAGSAADRVGGGSGKAVVSIFNMLTEFLDKAILGMEGSAKADQAVFVEQSTALKENLRVKNNDKAAEETKKAENIANIAQNLADLALRMGLVDDSLKTVDSMKLICQDLGGLNFGARKKKRAEEVASLNVAMKLLSANSN